MLTDEGRRASWVIKIETTKKPEAQLLGSAIGMKVMEDVPYIIGLDKWIGDELDDEACTYLKDFGAATASNGAVGLYHIDNLTPEAKEQGKDLIKDDAKEYIIDSLAAAGAVLADVWVEDVNMPVIDCLGDEFLDYVKDDMTITIQEDGTVVVD